VSGVVAFDLRAAVGRPTGVGRYLLSLAIAGGRLPDVSIRAYVRKGQAEAGRTAFGQAIDIVEIGAPGPLWHLGVWRHLRRHRVAAYLSTSLVLPALPKVPALPVILDVVSFRLPGHQQRRTRIFERLLMRRAVRGHPLVLLSEATALDVADLFGTVRGVVVPPWFEQSGMPAVESDPADRTAELGALGIAGPYLLMVGTIEPRKNAGFAADVVERLRADGRDIRLVLAGRRGWASDDEIEALRRHQEAGDVVWLGYVTDEQRETVYRMASAVLLPSMYEGFGMPLIEAMARGVPCCCSEIAVFREVAGDAAVMAPVGDRAAWVIALGNLLDDASLRSRLAAAGRRRAEGYTIDRTARALDLALRQLD
jgi:glycosyltransferase involved in cell wall biosynthesis